MSQKTFTSYALLGSGRVARHFQFYLNSLELPVTFWSRNGAEQFNTFSDADAQTRLVKSVEHASHVLLAVRDGAVETLAAQISAKKIVHFAGALDVPDTVAAHPLMTFGPELEGAEWYPHIPFIVDAGHTLADVLPGLKNPHWSIAREQRPLYHALCSLAGNASFLLWQNISEEFESSLGLPRQLLAPFLHKVVSNAVQGNPTAFTGPVARGDWQTVVEHLHALHQSRPALQKAYHNYLILAEGTGHTIPEGLI